MQIIVKGLDDCLRNINNVPKQAQFATSLAINETAKLVQSHELTTQLPSKLTLRHRGTPWQKPGTKYGINIKFSTKKNLRAIVGSQADWLKLQEEGGTHRVTGHRLAIPTPFWKSKRELMIRAKKPRTILNAKRARAELRGRAFIYAGPKMKPGIYARTSEGLKMLFRLTPSAEIPAILGFFTSGKEVVAKNFPQQFDKAFKKALATAKP